MLSRCLAHDAVGRRRPGYQQQAAAAMARAGSAAGRLARMMVFRLFRVRAGTPNDACSPRERPSSLAKTFLSTRKRAFAEVRDESPHNDAREHR